MRQLVAVLLVMALVMPAGAFAQQTGQAGASQASPPASEQSSVDASKLGVDLARIKRELAQAEESEESDSPLRLRFTVQVLGVAPKIDLLEGFKLSGPIPYGAPTHQEFLDVVTPQAYKAPVVPIFGLAVVAAQKLMQYSKKQQCQAEIDEYRRLVMQGVAVSAPRCTQ
jgi:hypothetical protein